MTGLYLDTSALGRRRARRPWPSGGTLAAYDAWWLSGLLIVELRRLAAREGLRAIAEGMLRGVRTVPVAGFERFRSTARRSRAPRDCCRWRSGRSTRSISTLLCSSTAPPRWPPCSRSITSCWLAAYTTACPSKRPLRPDRHPPGERPLDPGAPGSAGRSAPSAGRSRRHTRSLNSARSRPRETAGGAPRPSPPEPAGGGGRRR